MKEIILSKYGEIILKGANRATFESQLVKELRFRLQFCGSFSVSRSQSVIYIEPKDESADIEAADEAVSRVFGIVAYSRAVQAESCTIEGICKTAREYLPAQLVGKKTFKVEAKRSNKSFPLTSPEISAQVGGAILSACPRMRVDVHNPDVTVRGEVREGAAFVHAGQKKGAGGMPIGSSDRGMLLLSGGIDSPVAGYMMAKRGVKIEAVHFESFPYTSERAREKVLELASLLTRYAGGINVHVVSLTHIQELLAKNCNEDYFTLLLRRYMMTIADRIAKNCGCGALITGESLGQVASQTMMALGVTDAAASLPVFRPCIGMDKAEIVKIAESIGTFETSIQPYEDCCTVFTPRHPRTRPELQKVLAEEQKLDFEALVNEAIETATVERIKYRP